MPFHLVQNLEIIQILFDIPLGSHPAWINKIKESEMHLLIQKLSRWISRSILIIIITIIYYY